ncbi:MAG: collagen-like protein, partial [Clostridia bacterium]|nr:collagen-like protein [Clostridia bacterium]
MLRFQVNNQTLTLSEDSDRVLYSGAREFVRFRMEFGEEWDGYFVIVRFFRTGQEAFELADIRDGEEYYVPHQVLKDPGSFYVSVFGVKGERSLATVGSLRLDVRASNAPTVSQPVGETEPTLLSEFVRLLSETATNLSLAPLSFRANDTHLQYKYEAEEETAWRDLVELARIIGPKGDTGARGEKGETGARGFRGEDGFGFLRVENADLDTLHEPGLYLCLRGEKQNLPAGFPAYTGDLIVLVFNEYHSSTGLNAIQLLF